MIRFLLLLAVAICIPACTAIDQAANHAAPTAALPGSALALRSSGSASADCSWTLTSNGFVGTYLKLDAAGDVNVSVVASGTGAQKPHFNIVVDDDRGDFDATPSQTSYAHKFDLTPGTHFIRIEFTSRRDHPDQSLTIHSLTVAGDATISNEHTDANALAASETYIASYRRGNVVVQLPSDITAGSIVHAKLVRNAFNFGTNSPGTENKYLRDNPPADSDAQKFQSFIVDHFNILVPSNAGKWIYQEPEPGKVSLSYADDIMRFAKAHDIHGRMHNLIWDTEQQPTWVRGLLKAAEAGDQQAKTKLRQAISDRIKYYVRDRAANYIELDVLNESVHRFGYWKVFGADGIADIFREVAQGASAANGGKQVPPPELMFNEYNVLQWSRRPLFKNDDLEDPYANWYRENIEAVMTAGGPISGIGVQYAADCRPEALEKCPHSAARIFGVLQNLSVTGLPITLTEFSIGPDATYEQAAMIYYQTLRLVYGTPQATSFLLWGFWEGACADRTPLAHKDWSPTPAGNLFDRLMKDWTTDADAVVAPDHTVRFSAYWGDYELTVAGKTLHARITKNAGRINVE